MLNVTVKGIPVVLLLIPVLLLSYFFIPQSPKPSVVGIDLGTTFSSVAAYPPSSGNITIFSVDDRKKLSLPSIVSFVSSKPCYAHTLHLCEVDFGRKLIFNSKVDPKRTFYDSKRFIGKTFDPRDSRSLDELSRIAAHYPFDIALNSTDGSVLFILPPPGHHKAHDGSEVHTFLKSGHVPLTSEIKLPRGWQYIHPEMISGLILSHMKKSAEKEIGRPISQSVISVPAEFDNFQRDATIRAAKLANLTVLKLISEPTAAALAYGLHKKVHRALVIVVDFGGGTLDVSLLERENSMFYVVQIAGNNRLGGQDLTETFMVWVANEVLPFACAAMWGEIHTSGEGKKDISLLFDTENLQDFRQKIEDAKVALTYNSSVSLDLIVNSPKIGPECRAAISLTREQFEFATRDIIKQVLHPIHAVLSSADVQASDVEEVVLVGGSTLIPKVREVLRDFFGQSEMKLDVDPELAVVSGAAVQAGVTSNAWPITVSALELPRDDLLKIECAGAECSKKRSLPESIHAQNVTNPSESKKDEL